MGIGIFDRLNFPASMANNTITFSENTQRSLDNLPPILTTWQMQDIANSNTFGYFVNPVANVTILLQNVNSNIITFSANVSELTNITDAATGFTNTLIQFTQHTNRISGVTPFDSNTAGEQLPLQPYYNDCIGMGKALTYLIYQSDKISNNAVIMGNFGSLYTGNTLTSYYNTLSNDLVLIQNSLNYTTSGSGTPEDPIVTTTTSNLSPSTITQITTDISTANSYMATSVTQDVDFYYNSRAVLDDYNSVKGFTKPGDSEKFLYESIASDKLKERI
jgi:hypothetical protein